MTAAPALPRTQTDDDALAAARALAPRFAERAPRHDEAASFPFENFDDLHRAGLLRLAIPRDFGGAEAGLVTCTGVVQEVARGDASTALVLAMQYLTHASLRRGRPWPAAITERLYREAAAGVALINALRVEPELGTPARGGLPATTAARTADGFRLSGHKIYSTGSPALRYFVVWARTDDPEPLVGSFLVPRETPGWRIEKTWNHLGMRATGSHDVIFEDAPIPAAYALDVRPPAEWGRPDPVAGAWNTVLLPALYHGVAVAARDWLVRYLHERTPANLGAALATLPRFQSAVGEIEALLFTNERVIAGVAEQIDAGRGGVQPGLVKLVVTTNAIKAVDLALALVGNPGLSRAHPLERYHRDVLCSRIHTPQDDTILLGAGRTVLGIT